MINLHLYSYSTSDEGRILREAYILARLGLFDRIDMIGIAQGRTRASVPGSDGVRRLCIGNPDVATSLLDTILTLMRVSPVVCREFRAMPVSCVHCHSALTLPLAVQLKRTTGAALVYDGRFLPDADVADSPAMQHLLGRCIERLWIGQADYVIPMDMTGTRSEYEGLEKEVRAIYLDGLGFRRRASGGTACNGMPA